MLPKANRLTKKKDFENVIKRGKGISSGFLALKFLRNNLDVTRVGFVVSKKISKKAVVRNRIKRRLREIMRLGLSELKASYDLVFFTKAGIEKKDFRCLQEGVGQLLEKARCLKN